MNEHNNIKLEGITKIFPPSNIALNNVDLEIEEGKIHSIIGENGAGKSTLMKVLYAMEKPTAGTVFLHGEPVQLASPKDAVKNGIGMVHQEFMLIPSYSILENIILGYEDTVNKLGFINKNAAREKLVKICKEIGFTIDPNEKLENLSIAQQQSVEILKQLYRDVQILILDEPTAVLAPQEVEELFKTIKHLREEGKTILFISHKLDEILEISDVITVMRQGELIWTKENKGLTKQELAEAMVGRSVIFSAKKKRIDTGEPVLQIKDLTVISQYKNGKKLLDDVCLTAHAKEILGVAGVAGNGQDELVQTIMGLRSIDHGDIKVCNHDIQEKSIRERRHVISFIAQDRKNAGSSQTDSLIDNCYMTHHYLNKELNNKGIFLNKKKINRFTDQIINDFNIVCPNRRVLISSLSGGNQQKVLVGREFELNNPLLVLDQPFRGLDVGSIEYIQQRIIQKRDNGAAILLISADLDDLFNIADRIVVIRDGKIVASKLPEETDRIEIGEYMLGSKGGSN